MVHNSSITESILLDVHPRGDSGVSFAIQWDDCPSCNKSTVYLLTGTYDNKQKFTEFSKELIFPHTTGRPPVPSQVPRSLADEYNEASAVLSKSAKASAALSRRILQSVLRDYAHVKKGDLAEEVQEVIDRKELPSRLAEAIDAIRNIGNFATHPSKSTRTGEIVPVEEGEAEWLLDTIDGLFDHYFVLPAKMDEKKQKLNQKLKEIGKPVMK